MSEVFTIRPVAPNDAEALRAIYNHAVHHTTATMDTSERSCETQAAWIAAHSGEPYVGLVAVAEDRGANGGADETVIAYASLSPFNPKPGYFTTVENSIYVHPDWWGRGVGRALLAALLADAKTRGFREIIASISGDNEASIYLHRSMGFVDAAFLRAVGFKHGKWIDVVYLQYSLEANP